MKLKVKKLLNGKYVATFTGRHWIRWIKRLTPSNVVIEEETKKATEISNIAFAGEPLDLQLLGSDPAIYKFPELSTILAACTCDIKYSDGSTQTGVKPAAISYDGFENTERSATEINQMIDNWKAAHPEVGDNCMPVIIKAENTATSITASALVKIKRAE